MKEVGVGLITRKAAANLKPTLEIKHEGDTWHSNQYSTFKNTTLSYKLGEEFDETTPDGRTVKSLITFDNGKFTHIQKKKDGSVETTILRWLEGDKLITTIAAGSVVCRREYTRE
uniref:Lipocln_cytosolic_FA-bd_dom domain-containing protein n=1 Tax=Caenorhabditis japonica TaxID=281687 RepID=H2W233_CAEJA